MAVAPTVPRAPSRTRRRSGDVAPRAAPAPAVQPTRPSLELDTVSSRWQIALDTAQTALDAAAGALPVAEVARRRTLLGRERLNTARALERLAWTANVELRPRLAPAPVVNEMLALSATVTGCLFDLDGVLTDSGLLHAWAWGEVLDGLLLRVAQRTHWHFIPFDRDTDYRKYIDGRPRLEGIHAFLGSRGIRLPEGRFDDPAEADTAYGLARRKGELVSHRLRGHGPTAMPGARRYLEAAGHAGLGRAVVSASSHSSWMLELAQLSTLIDAHVDAGVIRAEELRAPPAPDLLLAACRRLGVKPSDAVTFTHSGAGVAAGRQAGMTVIGVGEGRQAELLRSFGADEVVLSLRALLDRRLTESG
jgi:HAD superfamily hydrolase (TIGR01509 family)